MPREHTLLEGSRTNLQFVEYAILVVLSILATNQLTKKTPTLDEKTTRYNTTKRIIRISGNGNDFGAFEALRHLL
jgi:hypothetical protein